jgi:hemolysin III
MAFQKEGETMKDHVHVYGKEEEIANAITHGLGVLLSIAALVLLLVSSSMYGTTWHIVSFTIFGITMLLMYFCSTLLHSLPPGKAKNIFEIFDHSAIYFFIAGSYTPFCFIVLDGSMRWTLFGIVWGLAIGGTIFKSFFVKKYMLVSTLLYIVMGWMIVIAWKPLVNFLEPNGMILLVVGGLLYTVGAIFYVWRGFKFHHAIWHLFVMAGSIMHFFCILFYLLPWDK